MPIWLIVLIIVLAIAFLALLISGYIKAPPDTAYIITGLGKRSILIGRVGFRSPYLD